MIKISSHRIPTKRKRTYALIIHYILFACHRMGRLMSPSKREHTESIKLEKVKKILVIRLDFIGDMTVSTAGFKAIREFFPHAEITLLAANLTRNIVEVMPFFDRIHYFDAPWMVRNGKNKLQTLLAAIQQIKAEHYDMSIDMRGDFRHNILMYLSKPTHRLGFGITGCDFLLTHPIPSGSNHHMVNLCNDLIHYLCPESKKNYTPSLEITGQDKKKARMIIDHLNNNTFHTQSPIVVIHPGSSWPGRNWRSERFASVADRLIDKYNAKILLAGSASDKKIAREIALNMKNDSMIIAGKTSIREFVGVLEQSDVFLGLDSGPTHIASATGTKLVALYGPALPDAVGPCGSDHIVLSHHKDFPCSPCDQRVCEKSGHSCMDAIQVDEVFDAVSRQIEKIIDNHS